MMRRLILPAAIILALGVGVIAYASIPGPDGVIHACYKNNNPAQGAIIAIDHTASCPSGYTALNWNQTGPQGPVGPQGATGPQGPAGQDGVSGYEQVTQTALAQPNATGIEMEATCPVGKKPIAAGWTFYVHQPLPPGFSTTQWNDGAVHVEGSFFGAVVAGAPRMWYASNILIDRDGQGLNLSTGQFEDVPSDLTLYVTCITAS